MFTAALVALAALAAAAGSVVKPPPAADAGAFELLILHNNDMHARFEQTSQLSGTCTTADREAGKCYGGFPRVAHVVKEARKAAAAGTGPPVLYLNAGDTYTGTAWFTIYKWKIAAEFVNALRPDAVALNSEEFSKGSTEISSFLSSLTCDIIASNIKVNDPIVDKKLRKSVILDIGQRKVGVVGYLPVDNSILDTSTNLEFTDALIAVKNEVDRLQAEGINIIIALGHSEEGKEFEIAKIDGIDIVITGHKNIYSWNATVLEGDAPIITFIKQDSGKQVPVVRSISYAKNLGQLEMSFNSEGEIINFNYDYILLDSNVSQDSEIVEIISKYQNVLQDTANEIIGSTAVVLDGDSCSSEECNFGNLVVDAMVYINALSFEGDTPWTDASIGITHAGGILGSIAPTDRPASVTTGDLLSVLPSVNNIVLAHMSGTVLLDVLEHSVANYSVRNPTGQFLQFSGIRVEYDLARQPGERVVNALVRCWDCFVPEYYSVDSWRSYPVLMPAALGDGNFGYTMLANLTKETMSFDEASVVAEYMKLRNPVYPEVADRIILLNVLEEEEEIEGQPDSAIGLSCSLVIVTITLLNIVF